MRIFRLALLLALTAPSGSCTSSEPLQPGGGGGGTVNLDAATRAALVSAFRDFARNLGDAGLPRDALVLGFAAIALEAGGNVSNVPIDTDLSSALSSRPIVPVSSSRMVGTFQAVGIRIRIYNAPAPRMDEQYFGVLAWEDTTNFIYAATVNGNGSFRIPSSGVFDSTFGGIYFTRVFGWRAETGTIISVRPTLKGACPQTQLPAGTACRLADFVVDLDISTSRPLAFPSNAAAGSRFARLNNRLLTGIDLEVDMSVFNAP